MFRIVALSIYSKGVVQKKIPFGAVTYIHGENKKGKTLLFNLIDFVLSSSENLLAKNVQGLEEIDAASLEVATDIGEITFLRNSADAFFYMIGENDFLQVNKADYDNLISGFLCKPANETLDSYRTIFNERLSFRALTFLNFLEESGVGNLTRVFTKTSHVKHLYRAPEILEFAFERERMEKRFKLAKRLEQKEKELAQFRRDTFALDFYIGGLKALFRKYNLPFSEETAKNVLRINEFKKTFQSASKASNFDLNYLMYKSNDLSNQIRAQRELENQSNKITDRIDKFRRLSDDIINIFRHSEFAAEYIQEINKAIDEDQYSKTILSLKDYDATIAALKKEKKEYDEKIQVVRNNLADKSIEEKMIDAATMLDLCNKIGPMTKINDTKALEAEIQEIKKEIDSAKKEILNAFDKLNRLITTKYLNTKNESLIKEEKTKKSFMIIFDYKNMSSCGKYQRDDGETMSFFPGSQAKMTYWQLCIYLETIKYFKTSLPQMPLLNLLVMDGINQPFDDAAEKENYLSVLKSIVESCKEYGLQAIITSTDTTEAIEELIKENGVFCDLGGGLNPLHRD